VFAATSGVVNRALSTTSFVVGSGGVLSRTTEAPLFGAIGTTFGSGNGSTTFNVPNMYDKFIYLKGTTVSGTTPVQASGQLGALHTHTFSTRQPTNTIGYTSFTANVITVTSVETEEVGEVSHVQNEQNKISFIPLVCKQTAVWPVGTAMPLLWPSYNGANFPVSNYLICSGQAVSRTTYSGLYQLLGNHFGAGNGSTTFNIPDLRGLFVAGTRNIGQIQPSGYTNSTFEPSCFVRHKHNFAGTGQGGTTTGANNNQTGSSTFAVAPASSSDGLLSNQSNAANISVIWVMPVV
jgi:microcystin-dependent protein